MQLAYRPMNGGARETRTHRGWFWRPACAPARSPRKYEWYDVVLSRGYDPPSPEYETGALPIGRRQQCGGPNGTRTHPDAFRT